MALNCQNHRLWWKSEWDSGVLLVLLASLVIGMSSYWPFIFMQHYLVHSIHLRRPVLSLVHAILGIKESKGGLVHDGSSSVTWLRPVLSLVQATRHQRVQGQPGGPWPSASGRLYWSSSAGPAPDLEGNFVILFIVEWKEMLIKSIFLWSFMNNVFIS